MKSRSRSRSFNKVSVTKVKVSTTSLIGVLFPHCFFVVVFLILPDIDLMLSLLLFLLLVKRLQLKFGLC